MMHIIMKKRSSFRLIRAFDAVVILTLIFQPVSAPVFFAPLVAVADDVTAPVEETLAEAETTEEDPAPVTQEEELPADESQEEAEAASDVEPTSVPVEDETEEGIVEAEGDASIEAPVEEGRVEAEGESFIEADEEKDPTCSMYADPSTIAAGGGTTLIWNSSENVVSATLHPKNSSSWMQDVPTDGSWWISGIVDSRVYTLTIEGEDGQTSSCDAQVIVEAPEDDGDCDGDARCAEPVCSEDSVVNGSFSSPDVKNGYVWDYFDNNEVSGWEAEWYGGSSSFQNLNRPQPKIEIQAGVNGWAPASEQYAELDSDWDGPNGSVSGEPASISLKQTIPTVPGYGYVLTWDYSARPNHADNKLKVEVDGDSIFESGKIAGGGSIDWITESYAFTASDDFTTISFTETGKADSLGMFLDGVVLKCLGSDEPENGTITVRKFIGDTEHPAGAGWTFDVAGKTRVTDANGRTTPVEVKPGIYSVVETGTLSGYEFGSASCRKDGQTVGQPVANGVGAIPVGSDDVVSCDVVNRRIESVPRLIVTKTVQNDGFGTKTVADFPLYVGTTPVTSGAWNDFSAGTYTVFEAGHPGYSATFYGDCDADGTVTLLPGDVKSCRIVNDDRFGKVIVKKETTPDQDETAFDFVLKEVSDGESRNDEDAENFSLSDGQSHEAVLLPGKYSVSETVPEGWELTSAVCTGEESISDIDLSDGETVTCTFTNTKDEPVVVPETGKITVEKRTKNAGSDQIFSFIPSYSGNFLLSNGGFQVSDSLAPGFYSVREAELYGWDLAALACVDRAGVSTVSIDKNGMTAGIQLAAGGDVLCTFTNKDTKRSDDPWDGNGGNGGNGGDGGDGTVDGGSTTTALAAGPVVISGAVAAGAAETAPEDGSVEGTESGIVEGASDCVGGWPLWAWILLVIVHTAVSTLKRVIRKPVVQKWGIPVQLISAIVTLVVWYIFDICREYWPYVPIAIVFVTIASLFLFRHWKK